MRHNVYDMTLIRRQRDCNMTVTRRQYNYDTYLTFRTAISTLILTPSFCEILSLHGYLSLGQTDLPIFDHSEFPLPSARQHPSYGDCLEVKREYYQNSSVLDCVTQ